MRHESLFFLYSSVTRIKGVGGATTAALQRLLPMATVMEGSTVPTIRDLLFHLPTGLVDRRFTCPLAEAPDGVIATFVVKVESHLPPPNKRYNAKTPYKVICSNETGDITLVFFHAHNDYIKQMLPVGAQRVISGRTEHFDYRLQMTHPDIIAPVSELAKVQKPEPVYPLTVGLTSRKIARMVDEAIAKLPELPEWIAPSPQPSPLVGEGWGEGAAATHSRVDGYPSPRPLPQGEREKWPAWKAALQNAHHPDTPEELLPSSPARTRLAYDEILANQLYLGLLRRNMQQQAGEVITGTGALTQALLASLPFTLTQGQQDVLQDISTDMASGRRMGRLLQGDVGSGKTVVALLAMLRAVEQGWQVALMVPTEIIAQQHYETISKMLSPLTSPSPCRGEGRGGGSLLEPTEQADCPLPNPPPYRERGLATALLTGSIKGKQREAVLTAIASGQTNIIVGTHALFQEHVIFKNLALIVIDEQHRFGVGQRMALSAKGKSPHILHMTATPIPRSLTMTLYGDMDCSSLREKPAERQPITTRVVPLSRYSDMMERLKAALDKGEKVYWICPLIEEKTIEGELELTPEHDIAAAQSRFTEFKARFGDCVGLVHGRMKADARELEMRRFASGETRLLVATTVVEVGVDVRDATIMVIEKAERFGLSQLHQLRGRVGRGDKPSACVLLYSDKTGEVGASRLSILRESNDGFAIAEADLGIRGGGDLLGTRQSGLPRFVFTDVVQHLALLEHAKEDVQQFLQADPKLESERGKALRILLQLFGFESPE